MFLRSAEEFYNFFGGLLKDEENWSAEIGNEELLPYEEFEGAEILFSKTRRVQGTMLFEIEREVLLVSTDEQTFLVAAFPGQGEDALKNWTIAIPSTEEQELADRLRDEIQAFLSGYYEGIEISNIHCFGLDEAGMRPRIREEEEGGKRILKTEWEDWSGEKFSAHGEIAELEKLIRECAQKNIDRDFSFRTSAHLFSGAKTPVLWTESSSEAFVLDVRASEELAESGRRLRQVGGVLCVNVYVQSVGKKEMIAQFCFRESDGSLLEGELCEKELETMIPETIEWIRGNLLAGKMALALSGEKAIAFAPEAWKNSIEETA